MEHYLRFVVSRLAVGIGPRSHQDPDALSRAEEFIAGEFRSLGFAVERQAFAFKQNTYANLIAELRGHVQPERILIVGAHYDTVPGTPGADDNASGVAGLLGLARAMAEVRPATTVRFVAFSMEEPPAYRTHNMGSYRYARSLKEAGALVEGMICLEMIGYFDDSRGSQSYPLPFMSRRYPSAGNYIAMVGNLGSRAFTQKSAAHFRSGVDLPVVTLNAPPIVAGIDFSDHWSFNQFGYRALMVTDTAFYRNPHYHAVTDTPDTLDYQRMAMVVKGLGAAVERWTSEAS